MAQDGDEALAADLVEYARTGVALPPDDSDEDVCAGIALPDSATCSSAGEPEDDALDAIRLPCSDDDEPGAVARQPGRDWRVGESRGWRVGENTGYWISDEEPAGRQAQVLLANVVHNLARVPGWLLAQLLACCGVRRGHESQRLRAAAFLLGLAPSYLRRTHQRLQRASWAPWQPAPCARRRTGVGLLEPERPDRALRTMALLVREALGGAYECHSDDAFLASLARYSLNDVDVGCKFHSGPFVRDTEYLGMQCVRACTIETLKAPLPGLLIPSDFALVFDAVSIGRKSFSRQETLVPIGGFASHPRTGRLYDRLLAAPSRGPGGKGIDMKLTVQKALRDAPAGGIHRQRMRASLVAVGGDGADARGGDDHRHRSTGACETLFLDVHPAMNPPLAHWDLFHRSEVGGRWAVQKSAMALEIFDVGDTMNQLFGVGRRLTGTDFVVFLLLYADVARSLLSPFSALTQRGSVEAVDLAVATQALVADLRRARQTVTEYLRWLLLSALLTAYVDLCDLEVLWRTLRFAPGSRLGRTYPRLAEATPDLLYKQLYQGCGLQHEFTLNALDPARQMLLHPRCQCWSMRSKPQPTLPEPPEGGQGRRRDFELRRGKKLDGGEPWKTIRIPEWACERWTSAEVESSLRAPEDICHFPLRFEEAPRGGRPMVKYLLQGVSRFHQARSAEAPHICVMPMSLAQVLLAMQQACVEFGSYLQRIEEEMAAYFGSVGANPTMLELARLLSICWCWSRMGYTKASRAEAEAFRDAYRLLKPTLEHIFWPPPGSFPGVIRRWPPERDLMLQYAHLRNRVAMRARDNPVRYTEVDYYTVRRVCAPGFCAPGFGESPPLAASLGLWLRRGRRRCPGAGRVLVLVARFLLPEGVATYEAAAFSVKSGSLCLVGRARGLAQARYGRRRRLTLADGERGDFAAVFKGSRQGFLVEIVAVSRTLSASKIAAALDMDPTFHGAAGWKSGALCYHAVRLGHRFRFLLPPETPCETWGSFMHRIFDDMFATTGAERIAARLFIKEAKLQCRGRARDEAVVREIARFYVEELKRDPHGGPAGTSYALAALARDPQGEARAWGVQGPILSGHARPRPAGWRFEYAPAALDPGIATAILRRARRTPEGAFKRDSRGQKIMVPLSTLPRGRRAAGSNATISVVREGLQDWLRSEAGKEWRERRASLFDRPDACADADSDASDA